MFANDRNLEDRFGGNGGLSLRRVSKVLEVLQFQTRLDNTFSEDQWMASRVGLIPGANMAQIGRASCRERV